LTVEHVAQPPTEYDDLPEAEVIELMQQRIDRAQQAVNHMRANREHRFLSSSVTNVTDEEATEGFVVPDEDREGPQGDIGQTVDTGHTEPLDQEHVTAPVAVCGNAVPNGEQRFPNGNQPDEKSIAPKSLEEKGHQ
jgi:hypothetical protein